MVDARPSTVEACATVRPRVPRHLISSQGNGLGRHCYRARSRPLLQPLCIAPVGIAGKEDPVELGISHVA